MPYFSPLPHPSLVIKNRPIKPLHDVTHTVTRIYQLFFALKICFDSSLATSSSTYIGQLIKLQLLFTMSHMYVCTFRNRVQNGINTLGDEEKGIRYKQGQICHSIQLPNRSYVIDSVLRLSAKNFNFQQRSNIYTLFDIIFSILDSSTLTLHKNVFQAHRYRL